MDALQRPSGEAPVNVLSGGECRRVALCKLLFGSGGVGLAETVLDEGDQSEVVALTLSDVSGLEDLRAFAGTAPLEELGLPEAAGLRSLAGVRMAHGSQADIDDCPDLVDLAVPYAHAFAPADTESMTIRALTWATNLGGAYWYLPLLALFFHLREAVPSGSGSGS